jgi:hypothetical protein
MIRVKGTNRQTDPGEHSRDRPPPSGEDAGSCGVGNIESLDNSEQYVIRQLAEPIIIWITFLLYFQHGEGGPSVRTAEALN